MALSQTISFSIVIIIVKTMKKIWFNDFTLQMAFMVPPHFYCIVLWEY